MINKIEIEKDYYAILGVLPSVDDVVLAAVYRALLKKYHPDVFHGEKAHGRAYLLQVGRVFEMHRRVQLEWVFEPHLQRRGRPRPPALQ
jgi:curved DNA-binding protein CbpA